MSRAAPSLALCALSAAVACSGGQCGGGGVPWGEGDGAAAPSPSDSAPTSTSRDAVPLDLVTPLPRPRQPAGRSFLGRSDRELLQAIATKRPIGARGTSGTSLSLFINLEGPVDAAFKPRTKRGQKWSGEIVAYRLARLLEVGRVPPTISRRFRLAQLEALIDDEPELLERVGREAMVAADQTVVGAMSYWIRTIHDGEVEHEEQLERWTVWLRQGKSIPPERLSLARQLSDTIAFDYVTGNWDRWSGGNVLMGPEKRTLLIMDNNAAFNVKMSEGHQEHLDVPLGQVERWSAGLYRRLVALSEDDLRAELAHDPEAVLLLRDDQIGALLARRDVVVQHIESQMEAHGRDDVLCFP